MRTSITYPLAVATAFLVSIPFVPNLHADDDKEPKPRYSILGDPRSLDPAFTILFAGRVDPTISLANAVTVYATLDEDTPFQVHGDEKKITRDQLLSHLKRLYPEDRPDAKGEPAIVLAFEVEKAGELLHEPLKRIAEMSKIDVYQYGPVGKDYFTNLSKPESKAADPRFFIPYLTLFLHGIENGTRSHSIEDALAVFGSVKGDYRLPSVDRTFTTGEITAALDKFYKTWKPKEPGSNHPPSIILTSENWGAGADLYEPLKKLAAEYKIDIYFYYVCSVAPFATTNENDNHLADLIPK